MLPILLVLLIVLIALVGAGVIWLVASEALSPLVATIGSGVVIVFCLAMLLLLFARGRVRRLERELRTVRRSEGLRERTPIRFDDDEAEAASEPPLVHALDTERRPDTERRAAQLRERDDGTSASPARDTALLDEAVDAMLRQGDPLLLAEPTVSMPRNETLGYRLLAGWRDAPGIAGEAKGAPVPTARLGTDALARLTVALVRCALRLDRAKLGANAFVEVDLPAAVLDHRDGVREIARDLERAGEGTEDRETPEDAAANFSLPSLPIPLGFRVRTASLDPLAGGRLEDLTDAGAWLVETGLALGALDESLVDELKRRGVRALGVDGKAASEDVHAARGLLTLRDAGIMVRGEGIKDETVLMDGAELGLEHLSGPLIGAPRPLRDDLLRDEPPRDEPSDAGNGSDPSSGEPKDAPKGVPKTG